MKKTSELIRFVRKAIGDVGGSVITDDQDILDLLIAGHKDIARRSRCFEGLHTDTTVADQASYSLPSDYSAHKNVCRLGDYPLLFIRRNYLAGTKGDNFTTSDSEPKYFWIERSSMGFWPVYSSAGETIELPYYRFPEHLILYPSAGIPGLADNDAGLVDAGTYHYKITFYDSVNGIESEAYYIGSITLDSNNREIRVGSASASGAVLPKSYDSTVNKIRIYRTTVDDDKDVGTYYYCGDVNNGVTYYDDGDDDTTISGNDALDDELGYFEVPDGFDRESIGFMMGHFAVMKFFEDDEEYDRARLFRAKYLGLGEYKDDGIASLLRFLFDVRYKGNRVRYREF